MCICSFEHRNQIDDDYEITSDVLALVFRFVWQYPFSLQQTNDMALLRKESSSEIVHLIIQIYLSSPHN